MSALLRGARIVRRTQEVGLDLLEGECHAGPGGRSAPKYRRLGSCGPVPISRTSPLPTRRARRVRVARGVRPIAPAISLVSNPLPLARLVRMAWSIVFSTGGPIGAVLIVSSDLEALSVARAAEDPQD